jgi:hypothetical protein
MGVSLITLTMTNRQAFLANAALLRWMLDCPDAPEYANDRREIARLQTEIATRYAATLPELSAPQRVPGCHRDPWADRAREADRTQLDDFGTEMVPV